jgi:hypothetical protein
VEAILIITALVSASAIKDIILPIMFVSQGLPALLILKDQLVDPAFVTLASQTTVEFVLVVHKELYGVLPQTNASMFVVKTQLTMQQLRLVYAILALDSITVFVKHVRLDTSFRMVIVSLAPSTPPIIQ